MGQSIVECGRTHGRTDHCCTREESPCQPGAVHTWPFSSVSAAHHFGSDWSRADVAGPAHGFTRSKIDPGCVKTLRGIIAPGILGSVVMRRAKKRKNLSSARHYDQIRFRFRTTKTQTGSGVCVAAWRYQILVCPVPIVRPRRDFARVCSKVYSNRTIGARPIKSIRTETADGPPRKRI
jgi:hypothetical protein